MGDARSASFPVDDVHQARITGPAWGMGDDDWRGQKGIFGMGMFGDTLLALLAFS